MKCGVRKSGNNNAYCQDNETSWFDWTLLEKHADVHRFVKLLIARRMLRDMDAELQRTSLNELLKNANKAWHGVKLFQPDWSSWSHSLAFGAEIPNQNLTFHLIMNAYWQPLEFELPPVGDAGPWRRWIDTFLNSAGRHRGLADRAPDQWRKLSRRPALRSSALPVGQAIGLCGLSLCGVLLDRRHKTIVCPTYVAPVTPHPPCGLPGPPAARGPSDRWGANSPSHGAPPSAGAPRSHRHAPRSPVRAGCQSCRA